MAEDDKTKEGKALEDLISALPEKMQASIRDGMKDAIKEESEKRALAAARAKEAEDDDDDDDDLEDLDKIDLDELSNKELVGHLNQRFERSLTKALKPLFKKIDDQKAESETEKFRESVKQMKKDHKDFSEWGDELRAIYKENPTMSIDRAYKLARAENPDKAKELDEKFAKEDKEDDEENKSTQKLFGGLLPTSGTSDAKEERRLKPKDAADKAWDQTMQGLDEALIGALDG